MTLRRKLCTRCETRKPVTGFNKERRRKEGLQSWCKSCNLAYQREKKREKKKKAIHYMGGCCFDCGERHHPAVYEFHHLDPTEKDGDLSKIGTWVRIVKELQKCVMLCANCHRIRHHGDKYD